jgi:hypothetical protein
LENYFERPPGSGGRDRPTIGEFELGPELRAASAGLCVPRRLPDPTNSSASVISCSHWASCCVDVAAHSFIRWPLPRSKRSAVPASTSSSTRAFGSFTTSWLRTIMAKILPPTLSPGEEPNPVPLLTVGKSVNRFESRSKVSSDFGSPLSTGSPPLPVIVRLSRPVRSLVWGDRRARH